MSDTPNQDNQNPQDETDEMEKRAQELLDAGYEEVEASPEVIEVIQQAVGDIRVLCSLSAELVHVMSVAKIAGLLPDGVVEQARETIIALQLQIATCTVKYATPGGKAAKSAEEFLAGAGEIIAQRLREHLS